MENFLPSDFSEGESVVAVIAGRGEYPALLVQRVLARGVACRLVALEGEAAPDLWEKFPENQRVEIAIGHLGRALKVLKRFRVSDVILAGQVRPLRLFKDLRPDCRALCLLRKLRRRNAETIFSTICQEIEKIGIRVLDARSFMEADIVERAKNFPLKRHVVEHGIHIASEVARLDIGQSVIVKDGTVLCVEGFDGTDAMIRHAQLLGMSDLLLVKTSKPRHDFRFDVPIFGMQTVELMATAGVRYGALESGRTIILDRDRVLARAEALGIKIFGY
jgi:DUF1009 family protein